MVKTLSLLSFLQVERRRKTRKKKEGKRKVIQLSKDFRAGLNKAFSRCFRSVDDKLKYVRAMVGTSWMGSQTGNLIKRKTISEETPGGRS